MKKLCSLLAAFALAFATGNAAASERASEADAEALVKNAVQFYKRNGLDKALAEFRKNPGRFIDRDLYVTVHTPNADCLSHINPNMVGRNMMELRDGNGRYHVKERMEMAKKGEKGWQDFAVFNPVSKNIEPKRMYWEKHDGLIFAAGAYKAI